MTRTAFRVLVVLLGVYLVVRAAVEPFVIDTGDPSTYRLDWGGPSLVGVLAVHIGPGVVALVLLVRAGVRRAGSARSRPRSPARRSA